MAAVRAILLAVVLGALTTTGVAWWFALMPRTLGWVPTERAAWPGPVPDDWPGVWRTDSAGGGGGVSGGESADGAWIYEAEVEMTGRVDCEVRFARGGSGADPGIGVTVYSFDRASHGWPRLALCTDKLTVMTAADPAGTPSTETAVWVSALHRGVRLPIGGHEIRLPVKVLWGGFAANTGFFAGAWGMVLASKGAIGWRRRRGWKRRGCCEHCGYELAGMAMCPECGRARKA